MWHINEIDRIQFDILQYNTISFSLSTEKFPKFRSKLKELKELKQLETRFFLKFSRVAFRLVQTMQNCFLNAYPINAVNYFE